MTNSTEHSGSWERLGVLLKQRRTELGFRSRKAFTDATKLDYRLIYDIEEARRVNFGVTTLTAVEIAYWLRPGSITGFIEHGDDLAEQPVPSAAPAAIPAGWLTPEQQEAAQPYADLIVRRLFDLERKGTGQPGGEDVFPDEPRWAREWDDAGEDTGHDKVAQMWIVADARTRSDAARLETQRRRGTALNRGGIADQAGRASGM